MRRGSTTSYGSLRRRLYHAGLASLALAQTSVKQRRIPISRYNLTIDGRLGATLAIVLIPLLAIAAAINGSRVVSKPGSAGLRAPSAVPRVPAVLDSSARLTPQNVEDLAHILMSEASPGVANETERIAVGWTVMNRMKQTGTNTIRDVWNAYAHHAAPSDDVRAAATIILRGDIPDLSLGATHFYSPRSMPKQGEALDGFDTSGGLEQTLGLSKKNYRPGWATQYEPVVIAGARTTHFKFYRQIAVAVRQ